MPGSLSLILVAWLCYSVAIWSDKRQKKLLTWMLWVFITGFVFDLLGTWIMSKQNPDLSISVHGYIGQAALIFMFLHLIAALIVLLKKGRHQQLFSRFSIYAWGLWTLALLTGPFVH